MLLTFPDQHLTFVFGILKDADSQFFPELAVTHSAATRTRSLRAAAMRATHGFTVYLKLSALALNHLLEFAVRVLKAFKSVCVGYSVSLR